MPTQPREERGERQESPAVLTCCVRVFFPLSYLSVPCAV